MRKQLVTGLATILAVAFANSALAASGTAAKPEIFSGAVVSYAKDKNSLTVKGSTGEQTFKIAPDAKLLSNGKELPGWSVKPGEQVEVQFSTTGTEKTASSVNIVIQKAAAPQQPAATMPLKSAPQPEGEDY